MLLLKIKGKIKARTLDYNCNTVCHTALSTEFVSVWRGQMSINYNIVLTIK